MKIKSLIILALFIMPMMTFAQELSLKMDAVKISFVADMQNTTGTISGLQAKIKFNMGDLAQSSIEGTVDVSTLDTGTPKRDEHLKSADYFDMATYPTMSFKSISFIKDGNSYVMTGMMKIRDVEREEKIVFTYTDKVFKGETTIQAALYKIGNYADKKPEKTNVVISFELPVM
ncbi:MAG: polyisoprenoid-binding protein YceI [Crocinitomix sp.]|jgi:polyisoprenoid-binding protein YceI